MCRNVRPTQLQRWQWSEAEPFPPIAQVQQAGIWTMPLYESLRAKLSSDIPKPAVNETDTGLLTVDVMRPGSVESDDAGVAETDKCVPVSCGGPPSPPAAHRFGDL